MEERGDYIKLLIAKYRKAAKQPLTMDSHNLSMMILEDLKKLDAQPRVVMVPIIKKFKHIDIPPKK